MTTAAMDIKTSLKEAQLYQSQGLLKEARKRYEKAIALVEESEGLANKSLILDGIRKKLQALEATAFTVEKKTPITEISSRDKELIKRLFSNAAADDQDTVQLEGGVALAKFGQFDRAIADFEDLIKSSPLRIVAAKHILRCHMAIRMLHDPMTQFKAWAAAGNFAAEELAELSTFLEKTYGLSTSAAKRPVTTSNESLRPEPSTVQAPVSPVPPTPPEPVFDPYEDEYVDVLGAMNLSSNGRKKSAPGPESDDYVDTIGTPQKKQSLRYEDVDNRVDDYVDYVSAIGILLTAGNMVDIPVNLQTGNVVNLIVPGARKDVMELLKKGALIEKVKLNSPISINTGNCTVISVARIENGPKKGDYSVDLKIEG